MIFCFFLYLFNIEIHGALIKIVIGAFLYRPLPVAKKWGLENPADRLKEYALKHRKNFCKKTPA